MEERSNTHECIGIQIRLNTIHRNWTFQRNSCLVHKTITHLHQHIVSMRQED